MDQRARGRYMAGMTIGTRVFTLFHGRKLGQDGFGNRYYVERRPRRGLRARRWVLYAGVADASKVPAEWHSWLHYTTTNPLTEVVRWPWQKPHVANMTGTALSYRPPGHDYEGGVRAPVTGDYEAWTPGR